MGAFGGIPFDVGDVLAERYRLERLIGAGVTGVIVAAQDLKVDRLVSIKFLRTALASNEIRTRLLREARAIGHIANKHVVVVFDVGALDDGSPYMVMEHLEGRDLARVLKEDGPLSVVDAVDCMLQVCEAVDRAHDNGIIHRDIKPANLFLTRCEEGRPHIKVLDFGISKILDPKLLQGDDGPKEMTNAFTVLGSPRYMAPEQLRDAKDVDGRADLWSIGAVMFQLVTGRYAFDAENNTQASLVVLTSPAPLLRQLVPHAPPELEWIINKCLTKDRNERFQTAGELGRALWPLASAAQRDSLGRMRDRQTPLRVESEGGREPSPLLSSTPPTAFGRAVSESLGQPPSMTLKLTILAGGFCALLFAFGILSAVKLAAKAMGVLDVASSERVASPSFLAAQPPPAVSSTRLDFPSQAVTVTLDAGSAPP